MARAILWRYGYLDGLLQWLGHTEEFDIKFEEVKCIPLLTPETSMEKKTFAETIMRFGSLTNTFGTVKGGTVLLGHD